MVQQFINLVVGESCYSSVTWRASAIRDPGGGLVWNSECCHQYVMWSAEGSEGSPGAGRLPPGAVRAQTSHQLLWIFHALRPSSLWWLEESRMTFVSLKTLNNETGLKWGGAMTLQGSFCAGLPSWLRAWNSLILSIYHVLFQWSLQRNEGLPLWTVDVWGELTGWNEIWLGDAQLVSACVAVEISS